MSFRLSGPDDRYVGYSYQALHMLRAIRLCLINPHVDNLGTVYSVDDGLTDFGRFLFDISIPLAKIHFRQTGNYVGASDKALDYIARDYVRTFMSYQRATTSKPTKLEDFRASQQEINAIPMMVSSPLLLKLVDTFVFNHVNKENPVYLSRIVQAWHRFFSSPSAFAQDSQKIRDAVIFRLDTHDPENWSLNYRPASPESINSVLATQERKAQSLGIKDHPILRQKILAIITAYRPFLVPEIVLFSPQSEQAHNLKREEFYRKKIQFFKTTARTLLDKGIVLPDYAALPEPVLRQLAASGKPDQPSNDKSILSITGEHPVPILGSDSFAANCTLLARIANHDMNQLVLLQTESLKMQRDEAVAISINGGLYFSRERHGDIWPIVVMRSPYLHEFGVHLPLTNPPPEILNASFRSWQEKQQVQKGYIDPNRLRRDRFPTLRR